MKWFMIGLLVGALGMSSLRAASFPITQIFGRTVGGVPTPIAVDTDGQVLIVN